MKFTVTDPSTKMPLLLEAKPEQYHHELGYRINIPTDLVSLFPTSLVPGRSADDHHVDQDLLVLIGLAIEGRQQVL